MRPFLPHVAFSVGLATLMLLTGALVMPGAPVRSAAPRPSATVEPPPLSALEDRAPKLPAPGAALDYQIGGPYAPAAGIDVVVRDRSAAPSGRYDVCYVDAFQTQAEDASWWLSTHSDLLLRRDGAPIEDANWPGQYLLDTSTRDKRAAIVEIERHWVTSCARSGFDAVELDNLDSWTRSAGLLEATDNLALASRLVRIAHRYGLAAAQKNAAVLRGRGKAVARFDFAIAESCEVYRECGAYTRVYGRRVYEIEYTDAPGDPFARACRARGRSISVTLRDRMVLPAGEPDHRSANC